MNQHIQKQIDDLKKKFQNLDNLQESIAPNDYKRVEAFLKTSLESVWKEAEKEMLDKVIEKIEDYVYLAPFSEKTKITVGKLSEILDNLKQTT